MNELHWTFDNTYLTLPRRFYERVNPVPVNNPSMVIFNHALANALGIVNGTIEAFEEHAAVFSGNKLPSGAEPLAQAYAGHQFGHFTMLGDGRAVLLGEHVTPSGERFDVQLKGSGQTPFSRRGDGRAALGPMLREYIISEAMASLGVPTTRSLAVVATGEPVYRETALPGAVLTRIASSHIRVGTFEYAAALEDREALRQLADYTIARHAPDVARADSPYLGLLSVTIERQASLIAKWINIGFIHGVMNTDNMAISGETIDFGPCAFMDVYDLSTVFSSIDRQGRYAYGHQAQIARWNLTRFAETLLPLIHDQADRAVALAQAELDRFDALFAAHWLSGMRAKLGLFNERPEDAELASGLLEWMAKRRADFTLTLRALSEDAKLAEFDDPEFNQWREKWAARLRHQPEPMPSVHERMRASNPSMIPRNHLVEEALAEANGGDLKKTHRLLEALAAPFESRKSFEDLRAAPPQNPDYRTFCGT